MREITNVSQTSRLEDGYYYLEVAEKPEKKETEKTTYRIWKFKVSALDDNTTFDQITILMMPWESKDLLLALGGIEITPKDIEWDDDKVKGLSIEAKVVTQNYKGKDREGNEVIKNKYVLSEIKSSDLKIGF